MRRRDFIKLLGRWPEFRARAGWASYGPDLAEQYRLSGYTLAAS
jgi:hypothetical protein